MLSKVVAILLLAGLPARTGAFQEGGHLFTTHLVLATHGPAAGLSARDIRVITVCAELPDKTARLDATTSYTDLMRHVGSFLSWSLGGEEYDPPVIRMITVEQLLHGLTGGTHESVRAVAEGQVRGWLDRVRTAPADAREPCLCAMGFAVHLLGDAFAHRMIGRETEMYPTGRGHAGDFTFPDLPMYDERRVRGWKEYAEALSKVLDEGPSIAGELEAEVRRGKVGRDDLILTGARSCLGNGCHEAPFRDLLANRAKRLPTESAGDLALLRRLESDEIRPREPCDAALRRHVEDAAVGCEDVWRRYLEEAIPAFVTTPGARADRFLGWNAYDRGPLGAP